MGAGIARESAFLSDQREGERQIDIVVLCLAGNVVMIRQWKAQVQVVTITGFGHRQYRSIEPSPVMGDDGGPAKQILRQ